MVAGWAAIYCMYGAGCCKRQFWASCMCLGRQHGVSQHYQQVHMCGEGVILTLSCSCPLQEVHGPC
jgi:hypothetical protein